MSAKTPLQAVVSVICDVLCELPSDDQKRAIAAVCMTLGTTPSSHPIVKQLAEFFESLRPTQLDALMQMLDMSQKVVIVELAGQVLPPQNPTDARSPGPCVAVPPTDL
jgi:hypothetical protein